MHGYGFGVLPSAAVMRAYVIGVVDRLTQRSRLPLDHSVASLRLVDFMVDGVRRGRPEHGQVAGLLQGLGAYTGEVIVRRSGARWVDFSVEQRELFGQPVGIQMPDGRVWNPLGKVGQSLRSGWPRGVRAAPLSPAARPGGQDRRPEDHLRTVMSLR